MTAFRCFALAAVPLALVSGCRGGGGPKVTLRYHPPAGAAYHYALEQQNSMKFEGGPMAAMPEQTFTMHMYFTQLVTGPAPGGTAVTVSFDSTALESPGMGAAVMQPALERMRSVKGALVYDDRMHVLSASLTGTAGAPSPVTDQMGKSVKAMTFPLPDGPVGVGDSWTSENELPLGDQVTANQPIKSRTRLTVKEIQVAGADTAVLLTVETTFPGGPIEFTQGAAGGGDERRQGHDAALRQAVGRAALLAVAQRPGAVDHGWHHAHQRDGCAGGAAGDDDSDDAADVAPSRRGQVRR